MKRTVSVSLGGSIFSLAEDAYEHLAHYLGRLERHFSGDMDRQEIMNDIEQRMAEHLHSMQAREGQVIGLDLVSQVIAIMGDPHDIASHPGSGGPGGSAPPGPSRCAGKRLYRNPDDAVIGGVCSGLGIYWNLDPVILRVLFVAVALFGGGGVLLYIILWVVIPKARTAAERLEMRGEPVNAENLGKSFR